MINEKHRLSKKKPWRNFLLSLLPILFITVSLAITFSSEEISETESKVKMDLFMIFFSVSFLSFSLLTLGVVFGIYRNEFFYIEDNKINYEFTFIVKRRVSLPLEKINIVKIKRNIIDIIMKTSNVEIGSGSLTTSLKAEIKLCLNKNFAEKFSDYLQNYSKAIKEGLEFTETLSEDNSFKERVIVPQESTKMTVLEKIKYMFSGGLFISALLIILILPLIFLLINQMTSEGFTDDVTLEKITNLQALLLGLIFALVIFVPLMLATFIRAFVSYFVYRIEKTLEGIRISYGLLNKKSFIIANDKIQGYVISKNLFRQIFNCGNLKLCVVGIDEMEGKNNMFNATYLYPFGSVKKLNEIIENFLPAYRFSGTMTKSVKKSIIHTVLIPILTLMLLISPLLIYLAFEVNMAIFAFYGVALLGVIGRFLIYKYAAIGVEEDFICTQTGGFIRKYSVIKTKSVQEICTFAGFIRRRQNLCSYKIVYRGSNLFSSRIFVKNVGEIGLEKLK